MIIAMPAPPSRIPKLLSIPAVAEKLDLSSKTVGRMVARGDLRVYRLGRQIRIAEEDLELLLARVRK